jgi:hypothetical protein
MDIKSQGGSRAGKRVSVHAQFSCRLALIAVVFPQHRSDERLPELPNGFGVENPALVHLACKCVEFASHGPRSLKWHDEAAHWVEALPSKLPLWDIAVNYPNGVQPSRADGTFPLHKNRALTGQDRKFSVSPVDG